MRGLPSDGTAAQGNPIYHPNLLSRHFFAPFKRKSNAHFGISAALPPYLLNPAVTLRC
jgi:hypothetical protein